MPEIEKLRFCSIQCWNTYKRSDLQIIKVVKAVEAVEAVEETDFQVLLKV